MSRVTIAVQMPIERPHKKVRIAKVSDIFSYREEELDLLFKVAARQRETIQTVKRQSRRLFDLTYAGEKMYGLKPKDVCNFSAWLPLSAVSACDWSTDTYADLSDYPGLVITGDWSGIRDTCKEGIWEMLEVVRKELK